MSKEHFICMKKYINKIIIFIYNKFQKSWCDIDQSRYSPAAYSVLLGS